MRFQMTLDLDQELIAPSATAPVFPTLTQWLEANPQYQPLDWFYGPLDMEYSGVTDTIFCQLFPGYQGKCRLFYRGRRRALSQTLDPVQAMAYEAAMMRVLIEGYTRRQASDPMDWTEASASAIRYYTAIFHS